MEDTNSLRKKRNHFIINLEDTRIIEANKMFQN